MDPITRIDSWEKSMRSQFPKRQAGMGVGGWLMLLMIIGTVMTLASQIVPVYADHNTMESILDGMATENGLGQKGDEDLRKIIKSRFKLNNIRDFDIKENLVINRTSNGVEIVLAYEVRMPLVKNMDMIATFHKAIELRN
jgi:hypothetical protein